MAVEYGDKSINAQVYNGFGDRAIGGCGIRVSSKLAEDLGLVRGERVVLKPQN